MIQSTWNAALVAPFDELSNIMFNSSARSIYELLESYLKHKSDMVNYEAARAICEMSDVTSKELHPAVTGMSMALNVGL